jgi:peptidoglycan/LPS O-acetylase OafA/YrhL
MNQPAASRPHYTALDGLRGLAILLVVVYHNFGFINYFFFGWLGVDLFFVLSGFLITDILLRSLGSPHYLRNFYMRRVLRIFPLYYVCLIFFLLILPPIKDYAGTLKYYTDNQVWLWTYFQNWLYIFKPTNDTDILHHFWSLAVEEQFYLVWPLTILLVRKPQYLLMLLGVVLVGVIALRYIVWVNKIENLAYFNLFTFSRVDGICIGSMLALVHKINFGFVQKYTSAIVFGLAGLNFLFYFFNRYYNFTFPYLAIVGYTTFGVIFALLVHEAVTQKTPLINTVFSSSPLRFFGRLSYGLYVFHWPVYLLLNPMVMKWLSLHQTGLPVAFTSSVLCTLTAILISLLSYHLFEKHFLKLKLNYN